MLVIDLGQLSILTEDRIRNPSAKDTSSVSSVRYLLTFVCNIKIEL
jgi:hypothetical protein